MSLKPAVGASTFAFCLARELNANLVIDSSDDTGALLAAGLAPSDWPQVIDSTNTSRDHLAEKATQVMAMLPKIDGVTIASGDQTPAEIQDYFSFWAENHQVVSLQQIEINSPKIFCLDSAAGLNEQLEMLKNLDVDQKSCVLVVKTQRFKNTKLKFNSSLVDVPIFYYRFQPAARDAIKTGFGIPTSSNMSKTSKIVAAWLQEKWSEQNAIDVGPNTGIKK